MNSTPRERIPKQHTASGGNSTPPQAGHPLRAPHPDRPPHPAARIAMAQPRVVATSFRDVVEEYFRNNQYIGSAVEKRLAYCQGQRTGPRFAVPGAQTASN
ncbi:MAG TPA: hypothetical protein VFD42_06590 [Chloroflexota bacterium]|nr:hypothetical protein [Chloroflexota bacterium]